MHAIKSEFEQCKRDLAKKKGRIAKLLKDNEELKLAQGIDVEHHCYQAKETQCQVDQESKEIEGRLAKAIENGAFTEKLLLSELEISDDLSKELRIHQGQRRMTEKI